MSTREQYEKRAGEFHKRYYGQLRGARIIEFIGMNKDESMDWDEGFPAFKIQFSDGTFGIIEVSRDPEGNGGGFVFGLPAPKMDDYDKKHKLNKYAEGVNA
jgi:hypothetical protein